MSPAGAPRSTQGGRLILAGLALATIAVGLTVHLGGPALSPTVRDVTGDGLWAAMMTFWISAIATRASLSTRAIIALAVCFAVEFSQLYHATWLDAARDTRLGPLVLGSGFDPRDLVAYAGGVLAALIAERLLVRAGILPRLSS